MFGISLVKHEVTAAFLQSTKSAAEILKNSPQLTSVSASPTEEASQPCPSEKCFLILDCSGVTFFDYSGVSMLVEVFTWLVFGLILNLFFGQQEFSPATLSAPGSLTPLVSEPTSPILPRGHRTLGLPLP